MSEKTVSVLIPTYNCANYIGEAIESVLSQRYERLELIVVDDGSTDDTREVVSSFGSLLTYVRQPNKGVSSARNHAFRLSTGPYVLFLDSDDLLLSGTLSDLATFLNENIDVDLVYGDGFICDQNCNVIERWSSHWIETDDINLETVVVFNNVPVIGSALLRRHCLERVEGPFDESMVGYEDWDLAVRLIASECRIAYIDQEICMYRMHAGNKSSPGSSFAAHRSQSLIRFKLKVMESPFFRTFSEPTRYHFLYQLLTGNLTGQTDVQERILDADAFRSLSVDRKAALLYYLGVENILQGHNPELAQRRLKQALQIHPKALKSKFALTLLSLDSRALAYFIRARRWLGQHLFPARQVPKKLPVGKSWQD